MTPNTMANISLRLSPLFPFVWLVVDGRVEVVVADEVDEILDVCEVDDVVVDVGGGGADDDVVVDVGGGDDVGGGADDGGDCAASCSGT